MKTRARKITVEVDASTYRWLRALGRANDKAPNRLGEAGAEGILAQAAFCIADCAGRRTGSWEASVAESLLTSSGYVTEVPYPESERCRRYDEAAQRAWRKSKGME